MSPTLLALVLATLPLADPEQPNKLSNTSTPRKPHPLAPSLPELTDKEEEQIDRIVERFIQADTGKLKGDAARQAIADFQKLGPEATFALIRGLNRAAAIEHSCPAVTIAKKLNGILSKTKDRQLLDFARENAGAGVEKSRHMNVIKDLRVNCTLRKNALEASGTVARPAGDPPE